VVIIEKPALRVFYQHTSTLRNSGHIRSVNILALGAAGPIRPRLGLDHGFPLSDGV
jgi:hypothetical protein